MTTYYINRYTVNQAYGGPEEGGWWFECGIYQMSIPRLLYASGAKEVAIALRDRLQEQTDEEQDAGPDAYRRNLSSVCCEGRTVWRLETHEGKDYPTERPHYE